MIRSFSLLVIYIFLLSSTLHGQSKKQTAAQSAKTIAISGVWQYELDPNNVGLAENWQNKKFTKKLTLPGSLTTNKIGDPPNINTKWTGGIWDSSYFKVDKYIPYRRADNFKTTFWLQADHYYVGAAWYQKEIIIPNSWKGKTLDVFLERCHWQSTLFFDGEKINSKNSLGTPHEYKIITKLTPGKHTITIRVDNSINDIDPGDSAHSISDHTQTNWNGITGIMSLICRFDYEFNDLKITSDIAKKSIKTTLVVSNKTAKTVEKDFVFEIKGISPATKNRIINSLVKEFKLNPGDNQIEVEIDLGKEAKLWDEFNPNLYNLTVDFLNTSGTIESLTQDFGLRKVSTIGTQIAINDEKIFIRGTLECSIFPIKGYPPTDTTEWCRIMKIVKSFGLNCIRFHSWCPPEAAFTSADKYGVFLQVECSAWAEIGEGKPIDQYIYEESERIVNSFGNHPSFVMMTYGNEPHGKNHRDYLSKFLKHWKAKDTRRIYTGGAGWPDVPEADYHNLPKPRIQLWAAGLKSIINSKPPSTSFDWTSVNTKYNVPTVSHEIGQWCVYPDFNEMKEYTGILKPKNFEIFKDFINQNNLFHLADSFKLASGKLQLLCYKADIEAAMRTPKFGGFQLLDLHDFPGQGTATVGVLSPFWKEKGYATAKDFSKFCNDVVPIAKMDKLIYTNSQFFNPSIFVVNFSNENINREVTWQLKGKDGKLVQSGSVGSGSIGKRTQDSVGQLKINLSKIDKPEMLTFSMAVGRYSNDWQIFVYPESKETLREEIHLASTLDDKAMSILKAGGKVLLSIKKGTLVDSLGGDIAIGFSSIFWNTSFTNRQAPHTLGVLVDPKHKAFDKFPTQYHSNYQWWDAMTYSSPIILNKLTTRINPIVRVIDDWYTARSLGLVFECKVGGGKLLISGIDFHQDIENRIEAKQLVHSLKSYMNTTDFDPAVSLNKNEVSSLIKR
jgi:hypothetical protein